MSSTISTILVAGHDLKFFDPLQRRLEESGRFEFIRDLWTGHNSHDVDQSLRLLEQADVIVCEWCLGNLQWYSRHKRAGQKLVARFHHQEKHFAYLRRAKPDAIDHLVFVSEVARRECLRTLRLPVGNTSVISNLLDEGKFTLQPSVGEAAFTLGMIGVAPAMKRLDRALDLLENLQREDDRYNLRIKGGNPLDYTWILLREAELDYFRAIFERINSSADLRYRVVFDPPADDVNDWLTLVGYILSPSEFESFHMAVGEGLLAGKRPIIWSRDGAEEIWGTRYLVDDSNMASAVIREYQDIEQYSSQLRADGLTRHDPTAVVSNWMNLLEPYVNGRHPVNSRLSS